MIKRNVLFNIMHIIFSESRGEAWCGFVEAVEVPNRDVWRLEASLRPRSS